MEHSTATDTLNSLIECVANELTESPESIRRYSELATPSFADAEFLPHGIVGNWLRLPPEARVVAYMMARERADEDTRRGEASL